MGLDAGVVAGNGDEHLGDSVSYVVLDYKTQQKRGYGHSYSRKDYAPGIVAVQQRIDKTLDQMYPFLKKNRYKTSAESHEETQHKQFS